MGIEEFEQRAEAQFRAWDTRDRELALSHPKSTQVLRDGAVDARRYWAEEYRLVFLLKEVNNPAETIDKKTNNTSVHARSNYWFLPGLRNGGIADNGKPWDNWEVVGRWAKAILDGDEEEDNWPKIEKEICASAESRAEQLRRVAVVNIKKEGGGGSANQTKIEDYFLKTKDLLLDQLKLCDPHVIVCGGATTYQLLRQGIKSSEIEGEHYRFGAQHFFWCDGNKKIVVVNWFHFGYFPRLTPALKPWAHIGLVKAVRGILGAAYKSRP